VGGRKNDFSAPAPPRPGKMFGAVADAMYLTYSATVVLFWLLFNVMRRRRSSNWTDVLDTFYAFSIPPCTGVDKGGGPGGMGYMVEQKKNLFGKEEGPLHFKRSDYRF